MERIYLGCPYSHPDPAVREARAQKADLAAAVLMRRTGGAVFSPISHSHRIAQHCGNAMDHHFWLRQDLSLLPWFTRFFILTLEGWRESEGIDMEISFWVKSLQRPSPELLSWPEVFTHTSERAAEHYTGLMALPNHHHTNERAAEHASLQPQEG